MAFNLCEIEYYQTTVLINQLSCGFIIGSIISPFICFCWEAKDCSWACCWADIFVARPFPWIVAAVACPCPWIWCSETFVFAFTLTRYCRCRNCSSFRSYRYTSSYITTTYGRPHIRRSIPLYPLLGQYPRNKTERSLHEFVNQHVLGDLSWECLRWCAHFGFVQLWWMPPPSSIFSLLLRFPLHPRIDIAVVAFCRWQRERC